VKKEEEKRDHEEKRKIERDEKAMREKEEIEKREKEKVLLKVHTTTSIIVKNKDDKVSFPIFELFSIYH